LAGGELMMKALFSILFLDDVPGSGESHAARYQKGRDSPKG